MPRLWPLALLTATLACTDRQAIARADSLQAVSAEQTRLAFQLSAQKDSLTAVVLDADAFIARIDSQVSRVKGLPKKSRSRRAVEGPMEEQLEQRKLMLARVSALVDRAQATAAQLSASQKRERALRGENAALTQQLAGSQQIIADLGTTIQRQAAAIGGLQARVDSLAVENTQLGRELHEMTVAENRAFYIVGTERELLRKRVVERTGGTNLLVARVGRSLQPARQLDPALFTPVDLRSATEIAMPRTDKRYRIVSRQSVGDAAAADRKGEFRGPLQIRDARRFWGPSKYLIVVEM